MLPVGIDADYVIVLMIARVHVSSLDCGAYSEIERQVDHADAAFDCLDGRLVQRSVIDDQDVAVWDFGHDLVEDVPDGFLFVVCRNDY
jgi:hypothetical protein